jgi:hypothetical protein
LLIFKKVTVQVLFPQLIFAQGACFDNYAPRGFHLRTVRYFLPPSGMLAMPKIHMTKGLAAWTTAVVGTLGSGAGAYSIVGNPWAADEVAAVAPADASGELQSQTGKPAQPVPIPDEAGQPQSGSSAGLPDSPAASGRRPAMFLDPAVAPASHTEGVANMGAGRSYGQDPEAIRATADAYQPMPAPAFGQASSQAGPEPQLPEFQPPTGAGMPSSWAPNTPQDSTPVAGRSAIALAPPAMEEPLAMEAPPADPVAGSAGSTLALGGALRQAAQSTVADVESETPSGASVYANAASNAQPAITEQAEEPTADTPRRRTTLPRRCRCRSSRGPRANLP